MRNWRYKIRAIFDPVDTIVVVLISLGVFVWVISFSLESKPLRLLGLLIMFTPAFITAALAQRRLK